MAIGTGQVSLSDIQTEYGGSYPIQLSEYYSKGNAPASGEIQLWADFQGTSADAHTLISSQTASASSSIDFTSGIDSTYDVYELRVVNAHGSVDHAEFGCQFNQSGGSGWNETIQSVFFEYYNREDGGNQALTIRDTMDQANGTALQPLARDVSHDSDSGVNLIMNIFGPSSTTYVTNFYSVSVEMQHQDAYPAYARQSFASGYINTTAAIDEIQFRFSSGNIASGEFYLFGVS